MPILIRKKGKIIKKYNFKIINLQKAQSSQG